MAFVTAVFVALAFSFSAQAFDPVAQTHRCDYVVLAHDSLAEQASRLADHRATHLRTCLVKLSEVVAAFPGADNVEKIRNFVTHAYQNWAIAPTYLLIVGDANMDDPATDLIPTHLAQNDGYYAGPILEGDKKSMIHVGRIPARDPAQLKNVIDKILLYDSYVGTPDWLGKILVLTGERNAKDKTLDQVSAWLLEDEFSRWSKDKLVTLRSSSCISKPDVPAACDADYGYVNICGQISDVNVRSSTGVLPVLFSVTSPINEFNRKPVSTLGEDLLMTSPDRGAIAVLGSTHASNILEAYHLNRLFTHALLSDGVRDLGRLFSGTKALFVMQGLGHESVAQQFSLLGDPALQLKLHPLPTPAIYQSSFEIEDPATLQSDQVRIVHAQPGVLPLSSERMLRVWLSDVREVSDVVEWKIQDLDLMVKRGMVLSFWLNTVTSPSGAGKVVLDAMTTSGRLGEIDEIFDQRGISLDAQDRTPLPVGWQFIYADLSSLAGEKITDLRIRYAAASGTENGSLLVYLDQVRISRPATGRQDEEILNGSFEQDVDRNGTPDFWTDLQGVSVHPGILRSNNFRNQGNFSLLLQDSRCKPYGAQYVVHTDTVAREYSLSLDHFAPDPVPLRLRVIDLGSSSSTALVDQQFKAGPTIPWKRLSVTFSNPTFQRSPGRVAVQIVPLDCRLPVYVDGITLGTTVVPVTPRNNSVERDSITSVMPNPVTVGGSVSIRFDLGGESRVGLYVYDLKGRLVALEPPISFPKGRSTLYWNPSQVVPKLPVGVYFLQLKVDGKLYPGVRKITILH